jgi:hypothetical protein
MAELNLMFYCFFQSITIEYHDLETAIKLGEKLTPLPSR